MKIKAAVVYEKKGPFIIEELDLEEPRADEVLVRVIGAGVCHTDLAVRDQHLPSPLPAVLGHEGSGVVEKVGSGVSKVAPGDHVVMSFLTCGTCPACSQGDPGHCVDLMPGNFGGSRVDGSIVLRKGDQPIHGPFFGQSSFANYALANERNIVKVDRDLPLEILGPLGCGVQTGAGGVINSLKAGPGSSIAIFGVGSVGVSAILGSLICGCTTIIAVDIQAERLKGALEFGATHAINSAKVNPVEEIQKITGDGVEYSLECVGKPIALRQAVDSLRAGGTAGLIGGAAHDDEVSLNMESILTGRTITGITEGGSIPTVFIPKLIDLYKSGRFPFDKMVTFYPFEEINQAAEDSENGKTLKAILRF